MRRRTIRAYRYLAYFVFLGILVAIYKSRINTVSHKKRINKYEFTTLVTTTQKSDKKLKFILQWTSPYNSPFSYMGTGQKGFISRKCPHTNCYVTSDRRHLQVTKFDAIVFAGPELITLRPEQLPQRRSPHQKYVYANIESAENYPLCRNKYNGYFNWTWTYKLDSDVRWGYIVVKDAEGNVVGPNKVMHWMKYKEMEPVPLELRRILRGKRKTAAWFVSNCHSTSDRESYAFKLNRILRKNYNLSIDIYGECGHLVCPRDDEAKCNKMIETDYYFYLAFENAFSEDYVTEKLLNAVQHYAIPIVYGGANYSRFLPEGSYLNARENDAKKIAKKMYSLINNFNNYVEYFRWTNHYSYHKTSESVETDEYCKMCALLNDDSKVNNTSVYKDLVKWWDPPDVLCYGNLVNIPVNM